MVNIRLIMVVLLIIIMIEGVLFVAAPGMVKNFFIRHTLLMNHRLIQNATHMKLRIYGAIMIVMAILLLLWILHTMGIL
ncbi:MAG: hypothetical protein J6X66_06315 [Lachnospiraceae bacterium]|nr:hypothetical protein [Lachnospiraceae bacterium]